MSLKKYINDSNANAHITGTKIYDINNLSDDDMTVIANDLSDAIKTMTADIQFYTAEEIRDISTFAATVAAEMLLL